MKQEVFGKVFKNPVIGASGTFGFGKEYNEFYDISILGGVSSKGLTLEPRNGNDGIRITETPSGIMNSIGLENPGVRAFLQNELAFMKSKDIVVIANVGGSDLESYEEAVRLIDEHAKTNDGVDIIELNISCPNVKQGGMAFGINACDAEFITSKIRKLTDLPLVVKLSPNANNLIEVAKAVESAGADGLSLVNTFNALDIDINAKKATFNNIYAGLSGPAIMPIALRMTRDVCKNVKIPVIGMGGITNAEDAIKFIMAGATLVQFGTASFMNPMAGYDIVKGMENYFKQENTTIKEIRGII
ncbi:MAG: dihydroorotate dehydrogenase [Proteocatella sp.]